MRTTNSNYQFKSPPEGAFGQVFRGVLTKNEKERAVAAKSVEGMSMKKFVACKPVLMIIDKTRHA